MGRRREMMQDVLRRAVQEVVARGFHDPRIRGLITITAVEVRDDLEVAKVKVSVLPEEHEELTLHGLRSASKYVRHEVGERVKMRRVPELRFEIDRALKREAAVLDSIARANREENDVDHG